MRLSTKGRYGLRIMLELAMRHGEGPVMMSTLAACQGVSRKYLHSLLTSLRAAGLVRSVRGAGGGYVLARSPADIRADEVVEALEGSLAPVECVQDATICDRVDKCAARDVWLELAHAMKRVLSGVNLAELAQRQSEKHAEGLMYHI